MADFLGKTTQKARKEYDCDSCYWIKESIKEDGIRHISFADKRVIVVLIRLNKGKIRKGDTYDRCSYKQDGELFFSTLHLPEAHRICRDYDLYPD
ncbi:hypothetical protein CLV58_12592 [Spirosoma oryzae]|uniref:Uncharacterized protein n=1 Tax=Spirosoma oryzae TaxID=1469603 RepID=A0A2T0S8S9_9BACT|nr:hypothetical protein CLV58_12592 [Spirosoma oryzae]